METTAVSPYKAIRNSYIVASHRVDEQGPDELAAELLGTTVDVVLKTYHSSDTKDAVQDYLAAYVAKEKGRPSDLFFSARARNV